MSKHNLYKTGLVAAILSAVSWFVFVYGSLNDPGISEIDDPLQFFQTLRDTGYIYLLYGWGGILGTLLAIPYIVAFYEAMKDSGPMILLSMIIALIGAVLTTFGFFKPLTLVYFHLPLGLEASPEELPFLKIATEVSLELFESPWFLGSFLMFGLGFGLIAYYGWRTATGPKWLNGVGIVAGLSGLVWLAPFLPPILGPLTGILIPLNILTVMVWSIGLSIVLVRQREL